MTPLIVPLIHSPKYNKAKIGKIYAVCSSITLFEVKMHAKLHLCRYKVTGSAISMMPVIAAII